MKKLFDFIISSKFTAILLILFALALGTATFIEDRYDTLTARLLVYNALWFEIVMVLLAINFIGHIKRYNMLSRGKIAGFLFHSAFIIMILGAGITRYFGYEGMMHIREGESSNIIQTSEPYLQISTNNNGAILHFEKNLVLSAFLNNSVSYTIKTENGDIQFHLTDYIKNAEEVTQTADKNGKTILEFILFRSEGRDKIFLEQNAFLSLEHSEIAFGSPKSSAQIKVFEENDTLKISSQSTLIFGAMQTEKQDTFPANSVAVLRENYVYRTAGEMFMLSKIHRNAEIIVRPDTANFGQPNALLWNVKTDKSEQKIVVWENIVTPQTFVIDTGKITVKYGFKNIELPFALQCRDFILERYPGSNSPSSYASEVTVIDNEKNYTKDYRIFMNNVLDYRGYRFFQSSYDPDERGTVLSVNHDFWGTAVTYLSYALLTIAFVFTLISRKSRFRALISQNKELKTKRLGKILSVFIILFSLSFSAAAQEKPTKPVDAQHAEKVGRLTVQTYEGRFAPLQTLAIDVMHKISRKDKFNFPGKGKLSVMQIFLDMTVDSRYWQNQKLIYVREQSVRDLVGTKEKYASFQDFFDEQNRYKLQDYAEKAFRKKQSEQNTFDKEIIKTDERVNICMMVFRGEFLKIFPPQNTNSEPWIGIADSASYIPLTGNLKILNDDLQLPVFNYNNLLRLYFSELMQATESGNYARPEKIADYVKNIQQQSTYAQIIPSESKTKFEILYNKLNIFTLLRNIYAALSILILIFAFADNLRSEKSNLVTWIMHGLIALTALAFAMHTFGLAARWYLSGHAPWSNGYEALILVSWGGILAGFTFIKNSKITMGASVLLAFFMLMTAGHSSYDPQLTNLQPVLKSYWLIIHVAVLTISYSFLGSGFFLGIINLSINVFKNEKNKERFNLVIRELTNINEMNAAIGLGLATVGTFLGGVWANESWGRYWGWDAKETWALVIVIAYTLILHFRMIPALKSSFAFNVGSIYAFGSVLMTFIGVNYYLSKGMHSYGAGETPVFPLWAWGMIIGIHVLILVSALKEKRIKTE